MPYEQTRIQKDAEDRMNDHTVADFDKHQTQQHNNFSHLQTRPIPDVWRHRPSPSHSPTYPQAPPQTPASAPRYVPHSSHLEAGIRAHSHGIHKVEGHIGPVYPHHMNPPFAASGAADARPNSLQWQYPSSNEMTSRLTRPPFTPTARQVSTPYPSYENKQLSLSPIRELGPHNTPEGNNRHQTINLSQYSSLSNALSPQDSNSPESTDSPPTDDPSEPNNTCRHEEQGFGESINLSQSFPRMHACKLCGRKFPRPSGLRTHMNSHSGEKPHQCTYLGCDRTFSVRSNAKRHARSHGTPPPCKTPDKAVPYLVNFNEPVVLETESRTEMPPNITWAEPSVSLPHLSAEPTTHF